MKLSDIPNRLFRGRSIGTKSVFSHVALGLSIVAIMSALLYALGYASSRDMIMRDLRDDAIAVASWQDLSSSPPPDAEVLYHYGTLTDSSVFFSTSEKATMHVTLGENGKALFRYHAVNAPTLREFLLQVLSGEPTSAIVELDYLESEMILAGAPIAARDGSVYAALILAQPLDYFRASSHILETFILVAAVLAIGLSLLLSLILSSRLVKPIQEMTRAARKIGDGDYDTRVPVHADDELGELGKTLNTLCDRTVQAIGQMQEERDRLTTVVHGIREGLIYVDACLNVQYINHSLLSMLEEPDQDLFSRSSPAVTQLKKLLLQVIGRRKPGNAILTSPSGRRIYAAVQPMVRKCGGAFGAVCLLRDVSESERLEQLRRDYVANVSHELRTPLTGIRGMVEPLIDGCMETEEEKQSCYRVIYEESIRLEKLVKEMLDMSRLQGGGLAIELEKLDARGILDAALNRIRRTAEESRVTLQLETNADALPCLGNEDRILQVLIIFLDNALSFTPPGGTVTLFANTGESEITLGVRDTGVGIEHKDLPYIWERFYKADKSRLRTTGTGLGLAIAKLVVEHMQGTIECESEAGCGAEFRFRLKKV